LISTTRYGGLKQRNNNGVYFLLILRFIAEILKENLKEK